MRIKKAQNLIEYSCYNKMYMCWKCEKLLSAALPIPLDYNVITEITHRLPSWSPCRILDEQTCESVNLSEVVLILGI